LCEAGESPVVRLLLAEDLPRVVLSGSSLEINEPGNSGLLKAGGQLQMAAFSYSPGGVRLEGSRYVAPAFKIKPGNAGLIRYKGRPYRGSVTVMDGVGGLTVVNHLPLESYLVGVLNGEVDSRWPEAALKAQIVAARSYALYQVKAGSANYDLKTTVADQVYAGVGSEDLRAVEAVRSTWGEVLYSGGNLIQAFFHSSCGGTTASAREVWGIGQPAQEGVFCGECNEAPYASWSFTPEVEEVKRTVRVLYPGTDPVSALGIHKRTPDGRVQTLFARTGKGRILIDAGEFRRIIGYRRLPSTRFSMGMSGNRIIFTGEGYGHGVGLCQWGARGSALKGMDYRQILQKYYPGAEIRKAY
jgi:stage II sporulation protein D